MKLAQICAFILILWEIQEKVSLVADWANFVIYILVEEVLNFTQIDLVTEDVMLLDTGETLFVWIGLDSNKAEKDAVLMTAKDYLMSDPSERNIDIPIIVVKQSFEPPHFTGYFGAWDAELFPAVSYLILWIFFDFGIFCRAVLWFFISFWFLISLPVQDEIEKPTFNL